MSVYFRTVAPYRPRISILQRRLYGSKTSEQVNEDVLKILEDISALELKDPKQIFDDDIISRVEDIDFGEDGLPVSPIMDGKAWKRRFKQPRKLKKCHPSEMTEEDWKLMKNPYANTLISAVRQDGYYRRVFPTFFLQKMHAFVNPETKVPWLLPMGIRSRDETKVVTGISKYVGGNHQHIEFLKSKRWRKLQDTRFVTSAVWRLDMEDFILKQLRNRVYDEVAASQRWIMSANRDGGKWEDMQIGCLLVWENGDPNFQVPVDSEEASAGEMTPRDKVKPTLVEEEVKEEGEVKEEEEAVKEEEEREAAGDEVVMHEDIQAKSTAAALEVAASRTLVEVKGKLVPSYKMHLLLGRTRAAELKKQLKIEDAVRKNIILISQRTVKVQMWLWRLSGYARQPETSLFEEYDMKGSHDG
ncbi:uncharacterized protein DFL_001904 [Arthrobotrys flagrans]|uniref:Uncharacterized protein n=1 Tax=Arthrobotrys flagrans TaxID=97331 RepID=A0A437A9V4_ARTFL|nr:hypothetical protein DFL_001904 [Arthrobotrys flagrans]